MKRVSTGLILMLLTATPHAATVDDIRLPEGFEITVAADDVANARSMALGPGGTLFVGTRQRGVVHALRDEDGDGRFEQRWVIAEGLRMPNGVALHEGALYVAENHRILRYDGIESRLDDPPRPAVIAELPDKTHHGWRYMGIGPDDRLYVAIGAPCNVCDEPGFATIISLRPDGGDRQVFARGVRNSVGFDWNPATGHLWFTDNGRDWLGDDLPPDELNLAPLPGLHFGYPFCHGGVIADPDYGKARGCDEFEPPARNLGPHVAALGVRFYRGRQFPEPYRNGLYIAEHGSWNRSEPIGYRITRVTLDGERAVDYRVFAEGWLRPNGQAAGRPVDLLNMPDGSLLVSDDKAGTIYRISYAR